MANSAEARVWRWIQVASFHSTSCHTGLRRTSINQIAAMSIMNQQRGRFLGGRYRIDSLLGIGSSASVYLAHDIRLDRDVAAKLLHPGLATDATFVRRLSSEARAVAVLNHPNIVHVYDWGEESDGPFLILEFLAGGSLKDLLGTWGRISVAQTASIGAAAARALAFAHSQGIIHRDIKPANLLFDEHGVVHVADFGLARTIASAKWTEPSGIVLGTARYASPEQALSHSLEGGSDVYSLALVLYEAITGDAPFAGETPLATLMNRIGKSLPPATEAGPLMPLLEAATQALPENRSSAAEFAMALEQLSTNLPRAEALPLLHGVPPNQPGKRSSDDEVTIVGIAEADQTLIYGAPPLPLSDLDTVHSSSLDEPTPRKRHRSSNRRFHVPHPRHARLWWLLSAMLLLVVIAAGVFAIPRFLVFDHVVPRLVGVQLPAAQKATVASGLRIRVAAKVFSGSVPGGEVISQTPKSGMRERSQTAVDVVVSQGPKPVALPSVAGKTKTAALKMLDSLHLLPTVSTAYSESVPVGRVISISPASGNVPYGSKVSVVSSLGPHPRTIPQLSANSYSDAGAQLSALGLKPVERLVYSNTVQSGVIISTRPAQGTTGIPVGSRVVVTVSKGPQVVVVPTVAGEPISQAISDLQHVGLVVNEQIGPPFATKATTTDPAPGTTLAIGSAVTLYVA